MRDLINSCAVRFVRALQTLHFFPRSSIWLLLALGQERWYSRSHLLLHRWLWSGRSRTSSFGTRVKYGRSTTRFAFAMPCSQPLSFLNEEKLPATIRSTQRSYAGSRAAVCLQCYDGRGLPSSAGHESCSAISLSPRSSRK